LTNACASRATSCLKRRVVVAADSPATGAIFMVNRMDDLPAPSAQVNSRFINSAISPPAPCPKALGSRAGLVDHRNVKSNRLFHSRTKKLLRISYNPGQMGRGYFP